MRRIIMVMAFAACIGAALVPGRAHAFESVTDYELSEVRGSDGSVLGMFSADIFGEGGLSEETARKKWESMTEAERQLARSQFHQKLLSMSPLERDAVRQKMIEKFNSMSAEEQDEIRSRMNERLKLTTPAERKEFEAFRKSMAGPGPGFGGGRVPGGR